MLIGRRKDMESLLECCSSQQSSLVVVSGRRRIGKTFLVEETFEHQLAFHAVGVARGSKKDELYAFRKALVQAGDSDCPRLVSWEVAFDRLESLLASGNCKRESLNGKLVVFIDEMPWFDSAKSKFLMWFEHFWNSFAEPRRDVIVIVCGSASSWIAKNIFKNKGGGLHNRVTKRIRLEPFTLKECLELCKSYGLPWREAQVMECYMVFGGVPYYYTLFKRSLSFAQNMNGEAPRQVHQGIQLPLRGGLPQPVRGQIPRGDGVRRGLSPQR